MQTDCISRKVSYFNHHEVLVEKCPFLIYTENISR